MSASPSTPPDGPSHAVGAADPSMEDILASIRRILSDDEAEAGATPAAEPTAAPAPHALPPPSDALVLDASMMVEEPAQSLTIPPQPARLEPARLEPPATPMTITSEPPFSPAPPRSNALMAPEAAAAAAAPVGDLLRTLIAGREQVATHRGGPTIEDMVREELRPMLKLWLDTNLAPMVERLVRVEIERVVGRAVS